MKTRARKTLSSDLDIFGASDDTPDDVSVDDTDILPLEDASVEETANDIASDKVNGGEESSTDIAEDKTLWDTKDKETTSTDTAETSTDSTTEWEDVKTNDSSTEEPEDFDISKLFDDIEKEAQDEGNDNITNMLDELRRKVADQESELMMVRKQNEVINEKLMNRAGDDVSMWMYKPLIDNIDWDRNLKFFVANYNKQSNPKVKDKLVDVMMWFVKDLTWEDISDLISTSQNEKILQASGSSSSAQPLNDGKSKENNLSYEDSINLLF